jgi:hypothetical protein
MICVFVALLPFMLLDLIAAFMTFDRLLQLEHSEHHDSWVADGRPCGFFWCPPEGATFAGCSAGRGLSMIWPFRGPGWARRDPRGRRLLWRLRLGLLLWCAGMVFGVYAFNTTV